MSSRVEYLIDVTWVDRVQTYSFKTKKAWEEAYAAYQRLNSVKAVSKRTRGSGKWMKTDYWQNKKHRAELELEFNTPTVTARFTPCQIMRGFFMPFFRGITAMSKAAA